MAGFRNRRGPSPQTQGGYPPHDGQQAPAPAPYGQQSPYAQPPQGRPSYAPQQYGQAPSGQQTTHGPNAGPQNAPAGPVGEPEYFGAPGQTGGPSGSGPSGPYDDPGHTRAFSIHEAPDAYAASSHGGSGYDDSGYAAGDPDSVATYRAGQASAPPAGPRLPWKQLISGIVTSPGRTFWQMRDHQVWAPALVITFVYGLLAVFGFDAAREDVLNATLSNSIPWVVSTAVAVILSGVMLGAVTNALARQLGGDGAWAPTISLAMLITSLTDAPRLLFALFLGGGNGFVQILGWITWLACGALLTSMVGKSHDLPWPKALGAASIQLVALLVLFKLPLI